MARTLNRRQALAGVGGATLGAGILAAGRAEAAPATVRGSWLITPVAAGGAAAGFRATAAFAAGGVFVTTGSDEAGTGIGEWVAVGDDGFGFTYLNFHFGPSGRLANTVKVNAKGTFKGSSLSGQATLTTTDAYGKAIGRPRKFTFTGKRIAVESP